MAVDQKDAPEPGIGETIGNAADQTQLGLHTQSYSPGKRGPVMSGAVRHGGKDPYAERRRRFQGHALGQDTVGRQAQITMLLGRP